MKKIAFILLATVVLSGVSALFASRSYAIDDDDLQFLLMYYREQDLYVESPTRGSKAITQVAENISVVTADDIKNMNAHTVAEVLNTVTGVQVFLSGGPGSIASAAIQGSEDRHVAVFMDGIPLNLVSSNAADIGSLPVQNIERIEIIKGPASSSWGSSLGGVINIITKSGTNRSGNLISASYGSKNTGDFRTEASGKDNGIAYYLTAGRLQIDGFRPHNDFEGNTAYTKLSYDIAQKTNIQLTLGYDKNSHGEYEFGGYFITNNVEALKSSLSLNAAFSKEAELQVLLWDSKRNEDAYYNDLATGSELIDDYFKDSGYGANAKLTWKHGAQNIVLGSDYSARKIESDTIAEGKQDQKRTAYYINDTIAIARFSITPGIRYDKTDTNGDFTSPSMGMTYKLTNATLLRATASRGFNVPQLLATYGDSLFYVANPDLKMERVEAYQAGIETTEVPYVWMKMSFFRNDISSVLTTSLIDSAANTFTYVNAGRQRRQGMETEIKTKSVYNTSLSAGATFMQTKDRDTGEVVKGVPQKTYDIGMQYNDGTTNILLKGHYVFWNVPPDYYGIFDKFIFDLHASRKIYVRERTMIEAFADVHNLFNDNQYFIDVYKNPGTWLEAGVRYAF